MQETAEMIAGAKTFVINILCYDALSSYADGDPNSLFDLRDDTLD